MLETEVALRIESPAAARRLLRRLGFSITKRRAFESNTVFDTPDGELRRRKCLLRLRQAGRRQILTFKGPPLASLHKSREEVESEIAGAAAAGAILGELGYSPVFRYEKYRTEYGKPRQPGSVMLDETPIGCFLELEGPPRWIDRTARDLGYSPAGYITSGYGGLYLEHCKSRGITPSHMVFSRRK